MFGDWPGQPLSPKCEEDAGRGFKFLERLVDSQYYQNTGESALPDLNFQKTRTKY